MADRESMATSFGGVADLYERGRPGYPLEAVAWLLAPAGREGRAMRVADVGAGTGKLARAATELGAEVVAIDPDPLMLAQIRGIPTFVGAAEGLPLPDASVDAVLFGQAWHWVDVTRASSEAGRVLRPGGVLGLVWNLRDESVPWVAELTSIMHGSTAEAALSEGPPQVGGLEAMAWSRSYLITAADTERERVAAALGDLFDRVGAIGEREVGLPYVTRSYRGIRP